MAINRVQFQRGLPMAEFMERYGTQEQCHAALVASRWPDGFVCPGCGCSSHCTFMREGLRYWQCSACREQASLCASASVVSDGLWCFQAVTACGATHNRSVIGGGAASVKLAQFHAANTLLGNLKSAFAGTYHSFDFAKSAHLYLAEVQYRFNRSFDLSTIFTRRLHASAPTKSHPERRLRAAEAGG